MRRLTLLTGVVVVVAVALGVWGAASPLGSTKARWVITDLGTLGGKDSEAVAINELGHVVGNSTDASGRERVFLWRGVPSRMTGLGFGAGVGAVDINDADQVIGEDAPNRAFISEKGKVTKICDGSLTAINNHGQVVGMTKYRVPFVWQGGTMTLLPTLGAGRWGWAYAINDRGQIVGFSDSANGRYHAILWDGKQMINLGERTSEATAINDRGQVVGRGNRMPSGAFLWLNGKVTDLGTLGGASTDAFYVDESYGETAFGWMARTINNSGQVIGSSETTRGETHAFLWEDGRMRDLGTLAGRTGSEAVALNNQGQVVANSFNYQPGEDQQSVRAFVWQNGKATDLGTLGGSASAAIAINDRGQIVGWSTTRAGQKHAVLWTLKRG